MRTILDYVLEQPVRVGRATTVHRARRLPGDEQFALKVASAAVPPDEVAGVQLRLRREAGALSRVHHPGLVPLVEVLEIPAARGRLRRYGTTPVPATDVGIVLAWARLGSLADTLAVGSLPLAPAIAMAHQLAGALAALHAAGLVHGDISPGNVLRSGERTWWLSDLGEAAPIGAAPALPRRGTDGFVAPEVLDGAPIDEAADVFALGSVLAAAIGVPSPGDDRTTRSVHDLVRRATADDAADRPSARDLERAFEALTAPPDRPPPPPSTATSLPSPAGLRRRDPGVLHAVRGRRRRTRPDPPRRRRPSTRRAATVVLGAVLVAAAALVGLVVLRSGPGTRTEALQNPEARATGASPDVDDAEPCPGSSAATPAGAVAVPGDPDGVGCTIAVLWWPDRAEAERPDTSGARHRFSMGRPGDQLLLGDWDGDGRDTPALYDPSAGTVTRFDGWARSGEPLPGAVVTTDAPLGGLARVARSADGDQVEIDVGPRPRERLLDLAAEQVVEGLAAHDQAGLAVADEHHGRARAPCCSSSPSSGRRRR